MDYNDPELPPVTPVREQRGIFRRHYFPTGTFALVVLAFMLSFCVFTCAGQEIEGTTFSGIELMKVRQHEDHDFGHTRFFVGIALLFSIIGLAVSILKFRTRKAWLSIAGFGTTLLLTGLYLYLKAQISRTATAADIPSGIDVRFKGGFWIALLVSVFNGIFFWVLWKEEQGNDGLN